MKIIFLDIDGVLNTQNGLLLGKSDNNHPSARKYYFDPKAVKNLNRLVEITGSALVIISSWRFTHTVESLQNKFSEMGVKASIAGFTPNCFDETNLGRRHNREKEILAWLGEQTAEVQFVILDDEEANYSNKLKKQLVTCDPRDGFGNQNRLDKALSIIKSQ